MGAEALLDLLKLAIADHQRESEPGLRIVPVVDEDLAQDHDAIKWVIRRADGDYIAAEDIVNAEVAGHRDTGLELVITEALKASGLPWSVVIEEGANVVRARVKTPTGTDLPFSKAQRAVLSVISALFWDEFHQHSLGAISFSESDWDLPTFRAVWELLIAQLPGSRIGTLKTLIVISGGPFLTTRHCASDASVRYVVRHGSLNIRKRPADMEATLGNLVQHRGQLVVLFLGAGFSYSSEMPLGDEARDYALQQFFPAGRYQDYDLANRFYDWAVDNDRLLEGEAGWDRARFVRQLTLERVLREEFSRTRRPDSPTLNWISARNIQALKVSTPGRSALKRLLTPDSKLVVLTVNFDTLLEEDVGPGLRVIATDNELADAPKLISDYLATGGPVPYIKLHGTLDDRNSIVADVESASLGLGGAATNAIRSLTNRSDPVPWIYVGYSMRDPDVSQVLALEWVPTGSIEAWVDPLPPQSVRTFAIDHRSARWKLTSAPDIQQRCVTETADRFLSRFAEVWLGK